MKKKSKLLNKKAAFAVAAATVVLLSSYFAWSILQVAPEEPESLSLSIRASTRTPHALEDVMFEALRPGGASFLDYDIRWDFGDGKDARGIVANHMFLSEGTHTVSLAVEGPYVRGKAVLALVVQSPKTTQGVSPFFVSPAPSPKFSGMIAVDSEVFVSVMDSNGGSMNNVDCSVSIDGTNWTGVPRMNNAHHQLWDFLWNPDGLPHTDVFLRAAASDSIGGVRTCAMLVKHTPRPMFSEFMLSPMDEVSGVFDLKVMTNSTQAVSAYFYEVKGQEDMRSDVRFSGFEGFVPVVGTGHGQNASIVENDFSGPAAASGILSGMAAADPSILSVSQDRTPFYVKYFDEHRRMTGSSSDDYYFIDGNGTMVLKPLGLSVVLWKNMGSGSDASGGLERGLRSFLKDNGLWEDYTLESLGHLAIPVTDSTSGVLTGGIGSHHYSQTLRAGDGVMLFINEISPGGDGAWGTEDDKTIPGTGRWVAGIEHAMHWRYWPDKGSPVLNETYALFDPTSSDPGEDGVNMRAESVEVEYFSPGDSKASFYRHLIHSGRAYRVEYMTRICISFQETSSSSMGSHRNFVYLGSNHSWSEDAEGGRIFTYHANSMAGRDGLALYACAVHWDDGTVGWAETMLYVNNNPPVTSIRVGGYILDTVVIHFQDGRSRDIMGASMSWFNGTSWVTVGEATRGDNIRIPSLQMPDGDVLVNITVGDFSGNFSHSEFILAMPSISLSLDGPNGVAGGVAYINSSTRISLLPREPVADGDDSISGTTYYRTGRNGVWSPVKTFSDSFGITGGNGDVDVEYYRIWENGYSTMRYVETFRMDNTPPKFDVAEPLDSDSSGEYPVLKPAQDIVLVLRPGSESTSSIAYYYKMPNTGQEILICRFEPADMEPRVVWNTSGLDPGRYVLRIIALDVLGQASESSLYVVKES